MKTVIYIAVLVGLVACGRQEMDPAFAPLVAQFESDASHQGRNIRVTSSIKFGIPANSAVSNGHQDAICLTDAFGRKDIFVDQEIWNSSNEIEQTAILYHELGHCELGRNHSNEVVNDGGVVQALSIMNADVGLVLGVLPPHREALMEELFK